MKARGIERPAIIQGCGRSGTTLIYDLFTLHKDLGYLTNYSELLNGFAPVAFFNRFRSAKIDKWLIGKPKIHRFYPTPSESFILLKTVYPNFWRTARQNLPAENEHLKMRKIIADQMAWQGKNRFAIKVTGAAIFDFFAAMFIKPSFVWIVRDPRAVCYSIYRLGWQLRGQGQGMSEFEKLDAVITHNIDTFESIHKVNQPFKLVRYEDFVDSPEATMRSIVAHCNLEPDEKLFLTVRNWPIKKGSNDQWKTLSPEQITLLNTRLKPILEFYGYTS